MNLSQHTWVVLSLALYVRCLIIAPIILISKWAQTHTWVCRATSPLSVHTAVADFSVPTSDAGGVNVGMTVNSHSSCFHQEQLL